MTAKLDARAIVVVALKVALAPAAIGVLLLLSACDHEDESDSTPAADSR